MRTKPVKTYFLFVLMLISDVQGQNRVGELHRRATFLEPMILAAARKYDVDPHLLWTIAYLESGFDVRAVSYKNGIPCAFGLMQFVPSTAERYGLKNPHGARESIDAAARYVRDLVRRFDGRGDLVLAAYNAGEGTVEAFRQGRRLVLSNGKVINPKAIRNGGIPPFSETRSYVTRGTLIYQSLNRNSPFLNSSESLPRISLRPLRGEASIYALRSNAKPRSPKENGTKPLSLYTN